MKYVNRKIYYYRPGRIEMHYWASWTSRKMSGLNQDERDTWSPVSWPRVLLFLCPCSSSVVFWVTHLWSFWRTVATTARLSTAFMQRSERPASRPHQKRETCVTVLTLAGSGLESRRPQRLAVLDGVKKISWSALPRLRLHSHQRTCLVFFLLLIPPTSESHLFSPKRIRQIFFCYWRRVSSIFLWDFQAKKWLVWINLPQWRSLTKTWDSSLPTTPPMPRFTNSLRWVLV